MPRALRKRTSRPNYAILADEEDEPEAGPSNLPRRNVEESDETSGSDFAPDEEADAPGEEEDEVEDAAADEEAEEEDVYEEQPSGDEVEPVPVVKSSKAVKTKKAKESSSRSHNSVFPNPNHRHRAIPLFHWDGQVERLKECPHPFKEPAIVPTNSWSFNFSSNGRLNKAHGYNVGAGPLWELMEDRGWYKECFEYLNDEQEAVRRPRVHPDLKVPAGWEILAPNDAVAYIPSDTDAGETSPPLKCLFGKVNQQTQVVMQTLDSIKISTYIPGSTSHVLNAGASVWGLDWCPIHADERGVRSYRQYLAVAPLPTRTYAAMIGVKADRPVKSCIQIWTLSPSDSSEEAEDAGQLSCDLVLCIEGGAVHELRWCPLPAHDVDETDTSTPRKLGILAGTFADGSLSLYAVPDPEDMRTRYDHAESTGPVFVRMSEPLLRVELEDTTPWCLDWANGDMLAVGCANGFIAVYDVATALREGKTGLRDRILPTHYFPVHQSAIQTITWIRAPTISATGVKTSDNPTIIASGGFDGQEIFSDIRECDPIVLNRTRDVVNSMTYSAYYGGPITVDQENTVKAYSLAPSMLGRGHKLLEPNGPVWSVNASDYHPQLAVGVTDGSCLTTNIMRTTRRGSLVAFFVHKIFQLDYSRRTGEYRMLEHFLPLETQDRPSATKANKVLPIGTGAWPPEVGVQRVVWNAANGLAGAPLLASATGSGLCRIDWLMGRWYRERVPYVNVETIRQEIIGEEGMEEDSE